MLLQVEVWNHSSMASLCRNMSKMMISGMFVQKAGKQEKLAR
jgi:hypothetical protein